MGHFRHTYLSMSNVFYTMPITLVRFLLRYLPTPKLDVLYERSLWKIPPNLTKIVYRLFRSLDLESLVQVFPHLMAKFYDLKNVSN